MQKSPDVHSSTAGYSGTPLVQKLGLRPPLALLLVDAPREYRQWLGSVPAGVSFVSSARAGLKAAHLFVTVRAVLATRLARLRRDLHPDGFVWVSWPKKTSGMATDVTEAVIREVALPLGLVDIKVCAVSEVWSGLKLVIRKELRQ